MTLEIKDEITIGDIILEKGDKIEVIEKAPKMKKANSKTTRLVDEVIKRLEYLLSTVEADATNRKYASEVKAAINKITKLKTVNWS